ELQKLYDEKCFDLLICNEHKEDVKYETYIRLDELITQYKDFNVYKASTEKKKKIRNVNVLGNVQILIKPT
ncbi:CYIR protein, partial [Plasmodium cynomolgi strain B]